MGRNDEDSYCFIYVAETDMAVCVDEGDENIWLPKSVVTVLDVPGNRCAKLEPGDEINILIPDWMAEDKELI